MLKRIIAAVVRFSQNHTVRSIVKTGVYAGLGVLVPALTLGGVAGVSVAVLTAAGAAVLRAVEAALLARYAQAPGPVTPVVVNVQTPAAAQEA
jgi:hypothetical protein